MYAGYHGTHRRERHDEKDSDRDDPAIIFAAQLGLARVSCSRSCTHLFNQLPAGVRAWTICLSRAVTMITTSTSVVIEMYQAGKTVSSTREKKKTKTDPYFSYQAKISGSYIVSR